jgi:hypothetical protein
VIDSASIKGRPSGRPLVFRVEITAGDFAFAAAHRRVAISFVTGTLNSAASFSMALVQRLDLAQPDGAVFCCEMYAAPATLACYPAPIASRPTAVILTRTTRSSSRLATSARPDGVAGRTRRLHLLSKRREEDRQADFTVLSDCEVSRQLFTTREAVAVSRPGSDVLNPRVQQHLQNQH